MNKFTEEQIKEIISDYTSGSGIETLCTKFKVGKLKIKEVLKSNNVTIRGKGSMLAGSTVTIDAKNNYKEKKIPKEGKIFLAICKKTGKEYKDYLNQSGVLSEHIINEYNIEIPNNHFKRKYFLQNGKYWHEQYFTLVEVDIKEKRICKYCDWGTYDLENKTGCYENHLLKIHNIEIKEYLIDYPEDIKYQNVHLLKEQEEKYLENINNSVTCAICGKKLRKINQQHLDSHNTTVERYKIDYNVIQTTSKATKKRSFEHWKKYLKHKPNKFTSSPQLAIKDILENNGYSVSINNKKMLNGTELDIFIPDLNLAIEYNGNYWHSENRGGKSSTFHLNKTKLANLKNIRLIHIFEDEWLLKNDIVTSKIQHIIGKSNGKKIGARECKIQEIDFQIVSKFYDKYHLQGSVNTGKYINIGAYYNDIIVATISFSNKRNMTSKSKITYDYDLIRFATNSDYIVSGIGSKLFNFFIKQYNPNSIVSFADRRWSDVNTNIYLKLGFKQDGFTRPNYWYYKPQNHSHIRLHKFGFGLNALKQKKMYIDGLSEWECMQYHGYDRIWDCGLIRYVWQKTDNK